ncbi:hypothetical protein [Synechocystis sp. LKSZ1]|uniref:hypothetical protein n=1 Tax=Synechocystis sp. LKSZ1 TaxID=3144951 RepID=UPI00336BE65C
MRTRFPLSLPRWQRLMMVGLVMLSAGFGFGLALRSAFSSQESEGLLQTEQDFPPRNGWPIPEKSPLPADENTGRARYNSLQNP